MIINISVANLLSTLYYQHEYGKDIQEKPANCALIHVIDDVILLDRQWFPSLFQDEAFEPV